MLCLSSSFFLSFTTNLEYNIMNYLKVPFFYFIIILIYNNISNQSKSSSSTTIMLGIRIQQLYYYYWPLLLLFYYTPPRKIIIRSSWKSRRPPCKAWVKTPYASSCADDHSALRARIRGEAAVAYVSLLYPLKPFTHELHRDH